MFPMEIYGRARLHRCAHLSIGGMAVGITPPPPSLPRHRRLPTPATTSCDLPIGGPCNNKNSGRRKKDRRGSAGNTGSGGPSATAHNPFSISQTAAACPMILGVRFRPTAAAAARGARGCTTTRRGWSSRSTRWRCLFRPTRRSGA